MDIFQLPLFYISFKQNPKLEQYLRDRGFTNINHFQSIDGRKMKAKELVENGIISIRAYNDLHNKRHQSGGIPSLGAVGCTLSHSSLWNKCATEGFPYMIIVEDDVNLTRKFTPEVVDRINDILSKEKSVFIGEDKVPKLITHTKHPVYWSLAFYIISNEAAKEMTKNALPIDVQTDHYVSHLGNIGKINLEGFEVSKQKLHKSSIQDICVKCIFPTGCSFYIILFLFILLLILLVVLFIVANKKKLEKCSDNLNVCKVSLSGCLEKSVGLK